MLGVYTIVDARSLVPRPSSPSPCCWPRLSWRQAHRRPPPAAACASCAPATSPARTWFRCSTVARACSACSSLAVLYLQRVLGLSTRGRRPVGAFLPISLSIGVLSLGFSARLNTRFGPRQRARCPRWPLIAAGPRLPVLPRAGRRPLCHSTPAPGAGACMGIGGGLVIPALMTLAMFEVVAPTTFRPRLESLVNTTQQVGGALRPGDPRHRGLQPHGQRHLTLPRRAGRRLRRAAFEVASALALAALAVAVVILRLSAHRRRPEPAARRITRRRRKVRLRTLACPSPPAPEWQRAS